MSKARYHLPFINEFPPVLCRWVARKNRGRRIMTTRDIAAVSGLSRSAVDKLSKRTTWGRVLAENVDKFSLACGVNVMAKARQREFIRRRALEYIKHLTPAQRKMVKNLEFIISCIRGKSPA